MLVLRNQQQLLLWQIFTLTCCLIFLANIFVTSSSTNWNETVWNAIRSRWMQSWTSYCVKLNIKKNNIKISIVLYSIKLVLLHAKYSLCSSFQHQILFTFSQAFQDVSQAVRLTMLNYFVVRTVGRNLEVLVTEQRTGGTSGTQWKIWEVVWECNKSILAGCFC